MQRRRRLIAEHDPRASPATASAGPRLNDADGLAPDLRQRSGYGRRPWPDAPSLPAQSGQPASDGRCGITSTTRTFVYDRIEIFEASMNTDLNKIQGEWAQVSFEENGLLTPPDTHGADHAAGQHRRPSHPAPAFPPQSAASPCKANFGSGTPNRQRRTTNAVSMEKLHHLTSMVTNDPVENCAVR